MKKRKKQKLILKKQKQTFNYNEGLAKGSLIGLATISVSTGTGLIIQDKLWGGAILLLTGFGFIMWREYIKIKYA